jgi:hypothetical protein
MEVVVHTLKLRPGIKAEDFQRMMINDVFVSESEVPGSINRGGQSMLQSQHLLLRDGVETEYLWFIKTSRPDIGARMLEDARKRLETFAIIAESATYGVIDSLEIGRRDQSGLPIGPPKRGSTI